MKSIKLKIIVVVGLIAAFLIPAFVITARQNNIVTDVPEGSAFGRETALQYILANHPELSGLGNPSKIRTPWFEGTLTPEGWVGSNTVQYTKGEWTVTVSNAVIRDPVYSVEVEFTGDNAFQWKGTVDQDGNVVEIEFATAK
ncbi:unnamed protein product [marine sediment metagenome]|uniref:Uncharacterized protein n=1 Tax=marine sediment metagenome TaxID=412755 RepID=X1T1D7_9ZZZZ